MYENDKFITQYKIGMAHKWMISDIYTVQACFFDSIRFADLFF